MDRSGEKGQVLVIAAMLMTVLLGFLALVVDVGNAYAQRRFVQNGSDAAAIAAARVLANNLDTGTSDGTIVAVLNQYMSANNGGSFVAGAALGAEEGAWYVTPSGTRVAAVGSGVTIPAAPTNGFPQLAGQPIGGVEVVGRKQFDTFFAGVLGVDEMTVRASSVAGFGGISSVLLDSSQTGITVGPLAFDEEALQEPAFGNCGGYGEENTIDQPVDSPTECIFDDGVHFAFTTLTEGDNCSQSYVNEVLDNLIDDPESFGDGSIVVGETDIHICSGTRMSGLQRFVDLDRPILVPLIDHDAAAACNSNCDAVVTGFAYLRLVALEGEGINAYARGYWVDPRTMPPLLNVPVITNSSTLVGPVSFTLLR